jgi:PhoH-like ATPase
MTKIYVIDTNIILHNPYFLNKLENCSVIIHYAVLQELDTFKKDNELWRNVNIFGKILDKLHDSHYYTEKNVHVTLENQMPGESVLNMLGGNIVDNIVVGLAYERHRLAMDVEILSNDTIIRVKARGLNVGLKAASFTSYSNDNNSSMIYSGVQEWPTYGDYIDRLYSEGFLFISDQLKENLFPHMFFKITEINGNKTAIGKVNENMTKLELVNPNIKPVWGISSKNAEQRMALQLLLDPDIPLVTMTGKAGSGKTILALASALVTAVDEGFYEKGILLTKAIAPVGKDIGYLPGGKEEKLQSWMQSYFDNLDVLMDGGDYSQLNMEIEAMTYVRGRTLPERYIIIDEAQNLSKHEVKSIITRAGENSKIVLMGDIEQIDVPYLDSINNGLSYVINKFKEQPLGAHISLEKGVRSPLADIASKIL